MRKLLIISIYIFTIISCKDRDFSSEYGPVLVEIGNKKLYTSELQNIVHGDTSPEDSTAIANAFIDRWVKNNLLINDAEKFFSSDFEIEEKVERYKNDLIKYKYEAQIIKDKMSSTISNEELQSCYEKYKANYLLDSPIYKVMYAAIPANTTKIDRFYNAWLNDELDFIRTYCSEKADTLVLGHDEWIDDNALDNLIPKALVKGIKLKADKTIQKNINQQEHFLKFIEIRNAKDTIPLELISSKISNLLLHERKIQTIEKYKQDIYEKAVRSNSIKINL